MSDTLTLVERPLFSRLERTEDDAGKSLQDMQSQVGRDLEEQGVQKTRAISVGSWQVAQAIKHGYVIPGWKLIDYVRSTWKGIEGDKPSPICVCGEWVGQDEEKWTAHWLRQKNDGEHYRKPRKRFHLVNLWGEQGATKSSFVAQLLGLAHGGYDQSLPHDKWREAWDWCQRVTICNRDDLKEVAALLDEPGKRFDILYFDDLNSTIGKQLAWEDRDLYRQTFELLGMIRRNVGTIITTAPNIEMVIGAFQRVMTFEGIVFPNSTFKVERMCHDIHPYFWAKDRVTKIVVEEGSFDPYDTPMYYWKPYEDRTNSQGHGAMQRVIERIGELEQEKEGEDGEEVKKMAKKMVNVPTNQILDSVRESGIKIDQNKGNQIINAVKKAMAEKGGFNHS